MPEEIKPVDALEEVCSILSGTIGKKVNETFSSENSDFVINLVNGGYALVNYDGSTNSASINVSNANKLPDDLTEALKDEFPSATLRSKNSNYILADLTPDEILESYHKRFPG